MAGYMRPNMLPSPFVPALSGLGDEMSKMFHVLEKPTK